MQRLAVRYLRRNLSATDFAYNLVLCRHQRSFSAFQERTLLAYLRQNLFSSEARKKVHSVALTTGLLHIYPYLFNTLLRGYSLSEPPHQALFLYKQLQQIHIHSSSSSSSLLFDSFTFTFLLNSCSNSHTPLTGIQLHSTTLKLGLHQNLYVQTAILGVYTALGFLESGCKLFDEMPERNSVTWNTMISGLVQWRNLDLAYSLFNKMPDKNVITWTCIIDGFIRMNKFTEGFDLFHKMTKNEFIMPNEVTVLTILPAISAKGDIRSCESLHCYTEKSGFLKYDRRVINSMLHSYARCGCMLSAVRFFEEITEEVKNLVSWTTLLTAFALYGMGEEVVDLFQKMEKTGHKPNRVTFLCVLNACSHGGAVDKGLWVFNRMVNGYHITPDAKHYGCLVDMLGRAGRLEEAERVAAGIPKESESVVIWRTLLGACQFHGDVDTGERVTRRIMEMERSYGGDYVLMHNIFSEVGRFHEAERLRSLMDRRNAFKVPANSII